MLQTCKNAVIALSCLAALAGCGKANQNAPALNGLGQHPNSWVVDHRRAYQLNPQQCAECHGSDLKGGIAKVDCFNQGNLGTCHAGGHGPRQVAHPLPFKDPTLHGPAARANLIECQVCHATAGGAGSNPRFNLTIGTLTSGCETCHQVNMAHPKPWLSHQLAGNQSNACALCHGASFDGVAASGPSCKSCHTVLVAGQLPQSGSCTSCHPGSATSGSHAAHLVLPDLTGNPARCQSCHATGGAGSLSHYSKAAQVGAGGAATATVALRSAFNAKGASASYSTATLSCANVKCHGGVASPAWGSALDTGVCANCHTAGSAPATPQYNSYYSGEHALHVGSLHLACTECHDTGALAPTPHFANLSSVAFGQPASSTLRASAVRNLSYNATAQSCAVTGSAGGCHTDRRSW
jgi:predicted CxxxxCH...CXXCH cytochrome family protein